jgi:hypothetical protein
MSDADAMLRTLFAAAEPPARDPAFTLAVMEKVQRRRFWIEVLTFAPVAVAVCVIMWAVAPMLTDLAVQWMGPIAQGAILPALAVVLTFSAMAFAGRDRARA